MFDDCRGGARPLKLLEVLSHRRDSRSRSLDLVLSPIQQLPAECVHGSSPVLQMGTNEYVEDSDTLTAEKYKERLNEDLLSSSGLGSVSVTRISLTTTA